MRELSRLTGVPPGTIRYYINEGLLPKPHKTHRNMAYYDSTYIERIKLIRELQEKRYLPLGIIKQMLEQNENSMDREEVKTLLEIEGKLFKNISALPKFNPPNIHELSARMDIAVDDSRELERIGFVASNHDGLYDEDSVRVIEILKKLRESGYTREAGFTSDFLKTYKDFIEVLARQEVRLFSRAVTGKMPFDDMVRMAETGINLLNTLIGILRKRLILKISREVNTERPDGVSR
ncbi:MAG: hypothetical protein Kow0099_36030 [Candidatus Abyssubacteria bacterium]